MATEGGGWFNRARGGRDDAPAPMTVTAMPRATPSDASGARGLAPESRGHMRSIIALPNPEHDTWVAPGMSRAKS
jgi:hypothetical protein